MLDLVDREPIVRKVIFAAAYDGLPTKIKGIYQLQPGNQYILFVTDDKTADEVASGPIDTWI